MFTLRAFMNNQQIVPINDDEIDLRELLATIMKKKLFIISFTALITTIGGAWAFLSTPIYEVKSNLQIGFIGDELIAEPNTLIKTVNVVFNVEDKVVSNEEFVSEVTSISQNKNLNNFVEINARGISNEEALKKNKEVVDFIKNKYKSNYDQFITNTMYNIKSLERQITDLDKLQSLDIKRQIDLVKNQEIVKIDTEINRLKEQKIKNIRKKIELLNTQDIVKINNKIEFFQNVKLKSLQEKIKFNTEKLNEYTKEVNEIYKESQSTKDKTSLTILSLQILNYQNLILNSQNNIENLKLDIEKIVREDIANLQREKKTIEDVTIKNLMLEIDNINNIEVAELERKKANLKKDTLRRLEYKLNIELPNKKIELEEKMAEHIFHKSQEYAQNSSVVGDYIIYDYPVKPKKLLILVLSFLIGFMLSIFIVLFLNFIQKKD